MVDCFSTDRTVEIAKEFGAQVLQHKWENNYAKQFNWALDNCPIKTKWVLRLDADEYLYPDAIDEVRALLPSLPEDVTSLSLARVNIWMGRRIRRGIGVMVLRRFFRFGKGRCEARLMDEHIVTTDGRDIRLRGMFVDHNLNDLSWWSEKHVRYAIREAVDLLNQEYDLIQVSQDESSLNDKALRKRRQKLLYSKLPLFWRAFAYFLYRYFFRLGFLEGKEGFCWHFLQGFWYRIFVDAKIYEIKKECGGDPRKMLRLITEKYHITLQ